MPRVNRDLQRRMAARRDRERRRPASERGYRFAPPEGSQQPALEADASSAVDDEQTTTEAVAPPPKRARAITRDSAAARENTRAVPLPFTAFKAEYAYVLSDLRRVALVIGSLLVILLVLYFVLPR